MKLLTLICFALVPAFAEANVSMSPSFVEFGSVLVGGIRSRSIYVRNDTNERVNISIFHSCFSEINVMGNCSSLGPRGICTLSVTFHPRTAGRKSCSVRASSSAGGSASAWVSGTAILR
jgi:hypothetical protein